MRNEIRALIMDKGLPSFYITINPADIYNPLVKFLAGSEIDIDNLLPEQVPDYMEQSILVAKNPFLAARLFNIYLKAFLKIILGYDPSNSTENIGMLGPVSAYYGCVEAQGRGTLHCHMMVWLKGALNCDQIRDRVRFREAETVHIVRDHRRTTKEIHGDSLDTRFSVVHNLIVIAIRRGPKVMKFHSFTLTWYGPQI